MSSQHKFKIISVFILILALAVILGSCDFLDDDSGDTGDSPDGQYTLTVNHEGAGKTIPSEGEHNKDADALVKISVNPDEGWEFVEWGGPDGENVSENDGYYITMDEDKEIIARFEERDLEKITIKDDLIIEKGEEKQFSEKRIYLDGDLKLEPESKLSLKNSILEISLPYKEKNIIEARESSELIISDSKLKSVDNLRESKDWLEWDHIELFASDQSKINVTDSTLGARLHAGPYSENKVENSKIHLVWEQDSNFEISNSTLGIFVIKSTEFAEEDLYLENFQTGTKMNSRKLTGLEDNKLEIEDSTMKKGLEVSFSRESEQKVNFKNCDIELLWTRFPSLEDEVKLSNLPAHEYVEKFDLAQNIDGEEFPYNYVIEDSYLDMIKPEPGNNEVIISNSRGMVHTAGKDLKAELIDSEIVNHLNYISKEIIFEDSALIGDFFRLLSPDSIRRDIEFEEDDIIFNHIFKRSKINLGYIKQH